MKYQKNRYKNILDFKNQAGVGFEGWIFMGNLIFRVLRGIIFINSSLY